MSILENDLSGFMPSEMSLRGWMGRKDPILLFFFVFLVFGFGEGAFKVKMILNQSRLSNSSISFVLGMLVGLIQ